jgi:hypothetical protein
VLEFCDAALAVNPQRVGKPLFGPLADCHGARRGTYRIVFRLDEDRRVVHVLDVDRRLPYLSKSVLSMRVARGLDSQSTGRGSSPARPTDGDTGTPCDGPYLLPCRLSGVPIAAR